MTVHSLYQNVQFFFLSKIGVLSVATFLCHHIQLQIQIWSVLIHPVYGLKDSRDDIPQLSTTSRSQPASTELQRFLLLSSICRLAVHARPPHLAQISEINLSFVIGSCIAGVHTSEKSAGETC